MLSWYLLTIISHSDSATCLEYILELDLPQEDEWWVKGWQTAWKVHALMCACTKVHLARCAYSQNATICGPVNAAYSFNCHCLRCAQAWSTFELNNWLRMSICRDRGLISILKLARKDSRNKDSIWQLLICTDYCPQKVLSLVSAYILSILSQVSKWDLSKKFVRSLISCTILPFTAWMHV